MKADNEAASGLTDGIPQPELRALNVEGISTLGQLAAYRERDLLKLHGIGPKGTATLRQALQAAGLDFAD